MSSPSNSTAKKIEFLEKINELIDLCIDNGCYDTIKEMIPDDVLSNREILQRLRDMKPESAYCDPFQKESKDEQRIFSSFSLGNSPYPVKEVRMLSDLRGKYPEKCSLDSVILEDIDILKPWSCLFWAKLVRAELHKQNRDPWLKMYEKVILYLEANINIGLCLPEGSSTDSKNYETTLLNYLMELSAASLGEASFGYAERARDLSNKILETKDSYVREERERHGHPYDRWIWYNKGIAYQHTRRHQAAIGQFSEVIDKFFNKNKDSNDKENIDAYIEFLLNIAPAIMQTAEINLQGQLAYHALKSLDDPRLDSWLKKANIFQHIGLIEEIVKQVKLRLNLLRLEALLRLGDLDGSKKIIKGLHPEIEIAGTSCEEYGELPQYYVSSKPSYIFQVKFIEQKVIWYREEAIRLLEVIGQKKNSDDSKKKRVPGNIKVKLRILIHRIVMLRDRCWPWVQDNPQDKKVYSSNWAQLLGMGMKIIIELVKQNHWYWSRECADLLIAIIDLYDEHRQSLPDPENISKKDGKEYLRSDDPLDIFGIVRGLNDFYDKMIFIKSYDKSKNAESEKVGKVRRVISQMKGKGYYELLKNDHLRLLSALDEWDRVFGEHQNIEALNRCNKRVKWFSSNGGCKQDCGECFAEQQKEAFQGLLTCCGTTAPPKQNDYDENDNTLLSDDYENIMSDAEKNFSKYLKDNSSHLPVKESLHFMGLQRWNSLTPTQGRSVGGGYFIYHTDRRGEVDLGIAIDPGFDFVRNLFRQGFSIRDIDIILISHAHPDHLWDFESIVQLLHDLSQKEKIENRYHRINVILTRGVYQRYGYVIENYKLRQFIEPLVIDLHKGSDDKGSFSFRENLGKKTETQPNRWSLILPPSFDNEQISNNSEKGRCEIEKVAIEPTYAYHDDYSRISDSYGFIITFQKNIESFRFGYTGDTKWVGDDLYNNKCPVGNGSSCKTALDKCIRWKNVADQYSDCHAVLIHLGSLIDHKNACDFTLYNAKKCVNLIREKNHPYLPGMIRFLNKILGGENQTQKLILVGEFGEELRGGIRVNIVERLQKMLQRKMPILPVDVGLDVLLWEQEYQFICALCNKSKSWEKVKYERYGYDEAIFYVCRTCRKAYPSDVRQDRYRELYDVGRELTVLPN